MKVIILFLKFSKCLQKLQIILEEYFEEADIKNEDEGATPDITEESEDSASVLTGLDQGAVLVANILNISEKEVKKSRPNENQEKSSLPEKDTVGEVINLVELQDQGKSSPPKKDTIGTVMNPKKLQENQGKSSPPEKDIIFVKITNDPQQHQEQTTRILNAGIQMGFLKYSLLLDKARVYIFLNKYMFVFLYQGFQDQFCLQNIQQNFNFPKK